VKPDPLLPEAGLTPEDGPGAARRALAGLLLTIALLAAVVLQLTVVNRLPLPGAAVPDLVLLLVTAIAVMTGPATGALAGFAGGLALDTAPPAAHYAGEYALVFCLAGWGAARAVRAIWDTAGERDPMTSFMVMAVAAAAGEAGKAGLALLLAEPDVTGAAASRVLPAAICYDLLLAPFAYALVAVVTRGARGWGSAAGRAPQPEFSNAQRLSLVFRQASAGAAPGLRLAGSGANYHRPPSARPLPRLRLAGSGVNYHRPPSARPLPRLRLAGSGVNYHRPPSARPLPRLRLAGSRSPAIARTGAGDSGRRSFPLAGARPHKLNFAGDLMAGPLAGTRAGALAAGRSGRQVHQPGKNWLRASGPSGPSGRSPRSGLWAGAGLRTRSGLSAGAGAGRPLARRAPQAGWLGGSRSPALPASSRSAGSARALRPRRGWLGSGGRRHRTVLGSGVSGNGAVFRRASIARRNWYTSSPSRAWLRRSRHSWRKRRQRLLRMVGVGR